MPPFRSGKPHWRVGLSADTIVLAGLNPIAWTAILEEDPDVVGPSPDTTVLVDRPGLYWLHASTSRLAVGFGQSLQLALEVDGSIVAFNQGPSIVGTTFVEVGRLMQLPDAASLRVLAQGSGVAPSTLRAQFTFFSGARVGPVRWTG